MTMLYRPLSLVVSLLDGILVGAVFTKVWTVDSGRRSPGVHLVGVQHQGGAGCRRGSGRDLRRGECCGGPGPAPRASRRSPAPIPEGRRRLPVGYPQEMSGRIAASDALPRVQPRSERAAPSIRGTQLIAGYFRA